jgi:hypothetical protein
LGRFSLATAIGFLCLTVLLTLIIACGF